MFLGFFLIWLNLLLWVYACRSNLPLLNFCQIYRLSVTWATLARNQQLLGPEKL